MVTGSVRATGLTVAALLGEANPQSLPVVAANLFGDPFVWWMLFVVVLGMAIAHKLTAARAATVVLVTYLLLAAIMMGFTLLGQLMSGA